MAAAVAARGGAVPHRTYAAVNAPWAPPGAYTVRLTVDGKSYTQPITLKLDPRVKTPAAGLTQLATLTRELYDAAVAAHAASLQARALVAELDKASGADVAAFKSQVDSLAPAPAAGGRGGEGWWWTRGRVPRQARRRSRARAPRCSPRRWRCRAPTSRRRPIRSPSRLVRARNRPR